MSNGPQHNMMSLQGPPNVSASAGPGGEIPPNSQQPLPMSGFNQGQPMPQAGYRGPVMPGQGPAMNRKSYNLAYVIVMCR
jgi:hypothetical protein